MKVTGTKLTKEMVSNLRQKGNRLVLSNIYQFEWESDVFCLSKSGIISEFEIKVSRSDYIADFNKTDKHYKLDKRTGKIPNHFCYVVPKDLISEDEVPEYAGLIYYMGNQWFKVIKKSPKLHGEKMMDSFWESTAMKLYYKTL